MSITPAFSPGPWITQGALVGRPRRWMREDLYEQCSFHIAENIPSSVKLGTRPISLRMRSYSSGFRPWLATSSGVIWGSFMAALIGRSKGGEKAFYGAFWPCPELCAGGLAVSAFPHPSRIGFKGGNIQLKAILSERAFPKRISAPSGPARGHRGRIQGL